MADLKPCPFCGQQPKATPERNEHGLAFQCRACDAGTFAEHVNPCDWSVDENDCGEEECAHYREALEAAVARWNARPLEESKDAEIARLKAEVEKLQADHRWIPVTERLPDTSRDVQHGRVYNNGWFLSGVSQYLIDHGSHAWRGVDPTHWREILPP